MSRNRVYYRDKKGRFAKRPPTFFRVTIALNYVVSGEYFGAFLQAWFKTKEEAEYKFNDLKEEFLTRIENTLGYDREEWWFSYQIGESIQEVDEYGEKSFEIEHY